MTGARLSDRRPRERRDALTLLDGASIVRESGVDVPLPPHDLSASRSLRDAVQSFGPASFGRALRLPEDAVWADFPFEYVDGPRLEKDGLYAVLHNPHDKWAGRTAIRVAMFEPSLLSLCSSPTHGRVYCEHLIKLLADLAACPELRAALAAGEPTEPALAVLASLRLQKQLETLLETTLDTWTPARLEGDSLTLEVSPDHDAYYHVDALVPLLLRFRAPPGRRILSLRDLTAMRLSREMRRLIALCEDPHGTKRGVYVDSRRAGSALEILGAHPEWRAQGVELSETPLRMVVARGRRIEDPTATHYLIRKHRRGRETEHLDRLEARWQSADGKLDFSFEEAYFFQGSSPFVRRRSGGPYFPVDPSVDVSVAERAMIHPFLPLPPGAERALFQKLRTRLRGRGVGLPSRASMGLPEVATPDFTARIDGSPLDFEALLEAVYSATSVPIAGDGEDLRPTGHELARDDDLESAAAARLTAAGLVWDGTTKRFRPRDEDAAVAFWASGVEAVRADGTPKIEVYLSDRLAGVRVRGQVKSRIRASLVGGWLETRVSFEADDVTAEMDALRDALARKRKWVLLKDGSLASIARATADLAGAVESLLSGEGEGRLSVAQVGLLDHWAAEAERVELDTRVQQLRTRLRTLDVRPAEIPSDLRATLRPYQVQGLAWLQFLDELGTGGVLADDMGLGKTLMTLAFLARKRESSGQAPSLVVCPTSVVGNWLREAARFTPGLSVLSLAGSDRAKRFAKVPESDLVVTTYALLRLDVETLQGFDFRTVVFDEAQNIKNAAAATRHAAAGLRAGQKLALTGTPVENRLGELWSILDVCNPAMLGSERSFQGRFERPIANEPGGAAAAELRARVRPFVLRRSKAQVLDDLPPKEEIDIPCIPGPAQRKAYDALAEVMRRDVETSIATRGFAQSGIQVLTALLRLRQMCCDPRLVDATRPASHSAKREAFLSLVRELVAEGRRALVFSQFVELLHLWREDLDREGIEHVYLDGSTKHRDDVVRRFQEGNAPLFLLSLKAGGAGLNLTAADTVIHCDPWWNPAVEAQATDRTHRIGQTRSVTVYRLVLSGTIEEKIAELKARKRAIAEAIVREDAGEIRGLDEEDIRRLLSGVDGTDVLDLEDRVDEPKKASPKRASPEEVSPKRTSLEEASPRMAHPEEVSPKRASPEEAVPKRATGDEASLEKASLDRHGASVAAGERPPREGDVVQKLAADIRAHLQAEGIMQRDFAAWAGVSQTTLSRLLRGHLTSLSPTSIDGLSRALGRR